MSATSPESKTVQPPWPTGLCLAIGVWLMVLAACTAMGVPPNRIDWRCDPVLDAAVTRGDWETALEGHRQLLRRNPQNCLAIYHLGYIQGHLGERGHEAAAYEQAIACGYDQDDRLYFNLAMAYGELDQPERAAAVLDAAIRMNPDNGDHYFGLALIAKAAGRTAVVEEELRRAISVDAAHLEARLALARLCLDQGRWDDVRYHLAVVRALDPDNIEALALRRLMESRQSAQYERPQQ